MAGFDPASLPPPTDPDSLRRLFVQLGYAERRGIRYSARTLEWPESVAVDLRGRELTLLADADDGFFQVLLLPPHPEMRSLPQALLQRLFTTLEQRGNEAILALPLPDWSMLEFVLLADPRPPTERNGAPEFLRFTFDPRAIRPHQQAALEALSMVDLGPGEAAERALRAFRRAQQETFFRSLNSFSSYYLERRIATDPPVMDAWAALLPQMADLHTHLATALRSADPVQQVTSALGWSISRPPSPSATLRLHAHGAAHALLAILPDGHPLDQPLAAGHYPQLELIAALEHERRTDGLTWAILTNGRAWRLYSRLTSGISGAFYEVDLEHLCAFGDAGDLRYFAAFFGPHGLATDFARKVLASSQTLAKDVGENLKQVVFGQVFALLANAIADDLRRRGEYSGAPEQLELIRRATLVLLYRILFLLYAESRRLLPTMHTPYYAHSLTFLISDIVLQPWTAPHMRKPMAPDSFWAWEHLRELCAAVSAGRAAWGLPKYNGGLFSDGADTEDPHKAPHRLLARVQLGAMDLCKALDLLGRDPQARSAEAGDQARRLIDYAGLDVRRLGSIYEGLLEYRLAPDTDGETLTLSHSRRERKASGSYYTPDYIVAYIVEQAVGPVLEERARRFAELMPRVQAARKAAERARNALDAGRRNDRALHDTYTARLAEQAALEHAAAESLLDLKICDPAMGSGHFLVEAVNFVTDRLIAILDRHRDDNPILLRLERIRAEIRASLREQGVDELISDAQLSDLNLLRRLVMKRCVYGVDLNDMAVELARLSLWLNSFTVGAPLSFLDHHLKWGNSLIGARVQTVQQAMEGKDVGIGTQLDMFAGGSAFKEMLDLAGFIEELVEIADANAQQVEQSERLYREYERNVVAVKRLLDLWVSRSFGSKEANELITLYSGRPDEVQRLKAALSGGAKLSHTPHQRALDRARELFLQHRFLHWDLDFPEVFIDLHKRAWKPAEQAGFDAVVGNPPYDELSEDERGGEIEEKLYFADEVLYRGAFLGRVNLFRLFIARSLAITSKEGFHSFIIPMSLLGDRFSLGIRREILTDHQPILIEAFPQKDDPNQRIFFDAKLPTCIYLVKAHINKDSSFLVRTHPGRIIENDSINFRPSPSELIDFDPDGAIIPLADSQSWDLCMRLKKDISITEWSNIAEMSTGEIVFNQQFRRFLTDDPSKTLVLRGGHIQRYYLMDDPKQGEPVYIDLDLYLKSSKESLGAYAHKNPRIVFQESAALDNWRRIIATYLPAGNICGHKICYFVRPKIAEMALLAIFNSKFVNWRFSLVSTTNNLSAYQIHSLPIRRINFVTPADRRAALLDAARALYVEALTPNPSPSFAGEGRAGRGGGDWRAWREYWAALWTWADARLPRQADGTPDMAHEESDVLHDLLAFLAERMIELHKQKQQAAAAFTGALEQQTGSRIEEWTLKTLVQRFWEQPWEEIERALQKNRAGFAQIRGLRGKQAEAALQPLLRSVQPQWRAACAALAPILAQITATDRLIDLLVYRLYGLEDGEIDLVEGV